MSISEYSFPTRILFGAGSRQRLGAIVKEQGFSRPLLVTDSGLAALPIPAEIAAILASEKAQTKVFSGIAGNPVESQVVQGVADYRAHEADCIVALGGGWVITDALYACSLCPLPLPEKARSKKAK